MDLWWIVWIKDYSIASKVYDGDSRYRSNFVFYSMFSCGKFSN